jgi:hypothetical protein
MELNALEQLIRSYYLAKGAAQFHMDPRYWPPLELSHIIEDKVRFAVSRFDLDNRAAVDNAAKAFLQVLIERQAFSTSESPYGPMYQFQPAVYRDYLNEAQNADPIIAQAQAAGSDFWQQQFEALKG